VRAARGDIPGFSELRSLTVAPDPAASGELKVWAHRVTAEEESEPLDVRVQRAAGVVTIVLRDGG